MSELIDLEILQRKLSYEFRDKALLKWALVHKSYLNEHRDSSLESNERLAWLGDAVLYLVAANKLYSGHARDKGALTELRKRIIRNERAAESGRKLELERFLLLSKGERARREKPQKILSNAYEAIIGAVFIDQGYDSAKKVVSRTLSMPDSKG